MAIHRFPPGNPAPEALERFGSRLEIEVGPPRIRDMEFGRRPRNQKYSRMPALIDTGASRTVLTPQAIQVLNLPLVDYVTLSRAGGVDTAPVYVASIQFPRYKLTPIDVIQVLCCELPDQPVQCLIGRDILSRWRITYSGRTGEWFIDEEDSASSAALSPGHPWPVPSSSVTDLLETPSLAIPPWVEPPQGANNDVFVCHASEDKPFVEPLVSALKAAGVRVWYDKDRMRWGDNLRSAIDEGLLNSRFGIVVFSKAFLRKKRWTEHELNGLLAKERAGEKVILPIWHKITQEDLAGYSTTFVDRLALDSQQNSIEEIVRTLQSLLRPKS